MQRDLRYVKDEEKFLKYAWDVFESWYVVEDEFRDQYATLQGDEVKNSFLMLAAFYKFLVKDARVICTDPEFPDYVNYIDETWKYIALMSLIEAAYTDVDYREFYEWLRASPEGLHYPINSHAELDALWQEYLDIYGATHKAVRFFSALPQSAQLLIRNTLDVGGEPRPIDYLAKLLYRIRSEFLHYARLILEFGTGNMLSRRNNKMVVSTLSLSHLQLVFESGLLRRFGFKPQHERV
jgi:hypothetical protein